MSNKKLSRLLEPNLKFYFFFMLLFVVVANLATLHYVNGLRFLGEEKEKMD